MTSALLSVVLFTSVAASTPIPAPSRTVASLRFEPAGERGRSPFATVMRSAISVPRIDNVSFTAQAAPAPVAVDYSPAYQLRARVHKTASLAMLPLFATEAWLGQSIYNNPTPNKKSAHGIVAGAIGGVFAVNSVTGIWNLVEARHDPNGRKRRLLHSILMLAADGGFLATAMLAPESEEHGFGGEREGGSRAAHRAVALGSISAATAGYLVMLIGGH